jgi:hypothetical protein
VAARNLDPPGSLPEYDIGVGIGWHRDQPHFDRIFGLSLESGLQIPVQKTRR